MMGLSDITEISDLEALTIMLKKMESECEGLSEEEEVKLLIEREIFNEKKLPVYFQDLAAYKNSPIYRCDYFEGWGFLVKDVDPSLWYTEAAWKYQFPGVEMPLSSTTISLIFNDEEYAFFNIFERLQIEAAKAQMMALNHLNT